MTRNNNKNKQNQKKQPVVVKRPVKHTTASAFREEVGNYGTQMQSVLEKGYGKTIAMTPSAARFAQVYADPFLTESARIPSYPLVSSELLRTYCSGKGVLNSNGNGWICIQPAALVANDATQGVIYSSGPAATDFFQISGTNISNATSNSQYTQADFKIELGNGNKAFRPVAQGIRIRYLGTDLNAAGTCYMLQMSPKTAKDDLFGLGITNIKTYPGFKENEFRDSSWHVLTRHIAQAEDFWYQGYSNTDNQFEYLADSGSPSYDAQWNMGIFMSATANQPFEFEIVSHYEIIGPNLTRRAITKADTKGTENVISAYAQLRHKDSTTPDHSVGKKPESKGGFMEVLKKGGEILLPLVKQALPLLLGLL